MPQVFEKTTPANLARINEMFESTAWLLTRLYERWLDEGQYEKIEGYAAPIRHALPAGFDLLRMTKRPFGFKFSIGTGATYHMTHNARGVQWKRA